MRTEEYMLEEIETRAGTLPQTPVAPRKGEDHPLAVFRTVWRLLTDRKLTIFGLSFAAFVLTWLVVFFSADYYIATASFIPPSSGTSSSMASLSGQLAAAGAGGLLGSVKSPGDLYVGILRSRSIAEAIVKQFNLMSIYKVQKESVAEQILAGNTTFGSGLKDSIVTISVKDSDPNRARDLANAYLEELRATSGGLALTESSQRRQFFEQRLALEKDQLANAEIALKQSQEKSGLIAPAGQTASEIQSIAQLRLQISSREVRLAALKHGGTDQNPDVIRLQSEIDNLRTQVAQMEKGGKEQFGTISTAQVPGLELEYIRKARDVKYHETLFDIIAKQYEAARLDEAHDPTLQILDRAIAPDTRAGPHRLINAGIGFLVALVASSLLILIQAVRRGELVLSEVPAS